MFMKGSFDLNKTIKSIIKIVIALFVFIISFNTRSFGAHCENIVVVIDPGHGGDSLGGNYEDRIERDINLITAFAMRDRLEQYDGVDVYVTRENNTDKEMTRKERFDFAKKVNADFLFSIHYNMSEYHTLFGSEVWIPSKGNNYVLGYQFATIEMKALTELGLFDRGIKNKLDKNKSGEYYGILKYSEEYDIPAVIIEHCHLDEERDSAFWNEEAYKRFGVTDADCVAKFFKLSSQSLGIDNSTFENIAVSKPTGRADRDYTDPEYCDITVDDAGEQATNVTVHVKAADWDNYIQYYQYSVDGGNTFSRLEAWDDRSSEEQIFDLDKTQGYDMDIIVRALNKYDLYTQSESVHVTGLPLPEVEEDITESESVPDRQYDTVEIKTNKEKSSEKDFPPIYVFLVTLIVLFITFNILFAVSVSRKKKRRRRKKAVKKPVDDEFDLDILE